MSNRAHRRRQDRTSTAAPRPTYAQPRLPNTADAIFNPPPDVDPMLVSWAATQFALPLVLAAAPGKAVAIEAADQTVPPGSCVHFDYDEKTGRVVIWLGPETDTDPPPGV